MLLQIHEPGQTPDPHSDVQNSLAIGIDLGTTHSVAALAFNQRVRTLPLFHGKVLMPSTVTYNHDQIPVVGLNSGQDTPIKSIKRLMGKSLNDIAHLNLPFELDRNHTSAVPRIKTGNQTRTPIEISADILKALTAHASDYLDSPVTHAVITVPAYFDEPARSATRDAAHLAGLTVLRLLSEPTAAALAYGLDKNKEGIFAVYDLGGGTFDFSILRLEDGLFQVLATGGDTDLGGDDLDRAISASWITKDTSPQELRTLLDAARAARETLSTETITSFHGTPLSREKLEETLHPFILRTLSVCARVLQDAKLSPQDIDGIVLVGGVTRTPALRRSVESFFGKAPLTDIDPDQVVAYGAALQAEALTKGSDTLLLDITPLSLGLETMGDIAEKLIYRNTPIPVSKKQEFTTFQDGQSAMVIHVVQGEFESASQCRSLAKFELHGIPPLPAGFARIEVTFALDADGLLSVSAVEKTTGIRQTIEVKPTSGLSDAEMRALLEQSMKEAGLDLEDRLRRAQIIEVERALIQKSKYR